MKLKIILVNTAKAIVFTGIDVRGFRRDSLFRVNRNARRAAADVRFHHDGERRAGGAEVSGSG